MGAGGFDDGLGLGLGAGGASGSVPASTKEPVGLGLPEQEHRKMLIRPTKQQVAQREGGASPLPVAFPKVFISFLHCGQTAWHLMQYSKPHFWHFISIQ